MKKVIYMALAVLTVVFLCCCTQNVAEPEAAPMPESVEQAEERVLTMAVQNGLSQAAISAVECFAEKVEAISNGRLLVEPVYCDDLLAQLDGGCDLAFGNNAEFARANGDFLIYSSPFYFADYNHLTMTLNSQQFNTITKNSNVNLLEATPLGCFYDGAYYIISSREEMYDTLDQYNGKTINILVAQPIFEEVIESLGAEARERDEEYMLENFGKNRNISAMECEIALLDNITKREKVESFHICKSFHRVKINWLMLSEQARDSLSPYQMAVITEATAYALAKNDAIVLDEEETSLEAAENMGGMVTALNQLEFSTHAETTLKNSEKFISLWDWMVYEEVKNIAFEK